MDKMPGITIGKSNKITYEDASYKDLVADWDAFYGAFEETKKHLKPPVKSNEGLEKEAASLRRKLGKLGFDLSYDSICFAPKEEKLQDSTGGRTFQGHVFMNRTNRKDPHFRYMLLHELHHASGTSNESYTEVLALESSSSLCPEEKSLEPVVYNRLARIVQKSLDLKARNEEVPEECKIKVDEILSTPLYTGYRRDSRQDILYEYGLVPYVKLKRAIKRGSNSARMQEGTVEITNIKKLWMKAYGNSRGKNKER